MARAVARDDRPSPSGIDDGGVDGTRPVRPCAGPPQSSTSISVGSTSLESGPPSAGTPSAMDRTSA